MNQRVIPGDFGWQWIPKTWRLYKKHAGRLIGAFFVFLFVSVAASAIPVIGSFVNGMLYPLLLFGALKIAEDTDQDRKPRVGDLFFAFSQRESLSSLLSVCLTSAVMMAISMFILSLLGGMMVKFKSDPMAMLPSFGAGMIALLLIYTLVTVFWFFAPGFIYFGRVSGRKAMEASLTAAVINWRPFLVMMLVWFGLIFAALVPVILASLFQSIAAPGHSAMLAPAVGGLEVLAAVFVLGPMHFCMPYFAFREIFPADPQKNQSF